MTLPTKGAGPSAGAAGISYLLRANFTGANQGYADAQVLDTAAEGVPDGQLTVVEVDGTVAIVSNECAFTAQGTPVWTDLGFVGETSGGGAFTKSLGLGLLAILNLSTWEEIGLGWHSAASVVDPDNMLYALQANTTDGRLDVEGGTAVYTGLATSTDYRLAILAGGFDANEAPYYSGQTKADYKYGAWYLLEVGGTFNLAWLDKADNTASIYAILSSLDAVGTVDDIVVPDVDLSAVQEEITNFSSFTAGNGTSLDAITPEVGGAWTEQEGSFDIQGNRAEIITVDGGTSWATATVDAGIADVVADTVVHRESGDANALGLVLRLTDTSTYWRVTAHLTPNELRIIEIDAGATTRASVGVALVPDTDYDLRAIAYGQTIDAFLDGGNKISYGSAALNETETDHGIQGSVAGNVAQFDNFAIYPRTAAVYDSELDLC